MQYDVIVLGTGGVGSAALFHLAKRGVRTLGLDRFPGGHDRGSSHGQTRVIRQAYFEHPDYVPLLRRAYELWADLEEDNAEQLFYRVGLLEAGPANGVVVSGVLRSAHEHGLDVARLSAADVSDQFPGFRIPADFEAVFEKNAGYLLVERCVLAHLRSAVTRGAETRSGETVIGWRGEGDGVAVETSGGTYHADRLVITAGAWAGTMLHDLGIRLRIVRKHLHWYATTDARYEPHKGCPTFMFEMPDGIYYGFPVLDDLGLKVAEHSGGREVTDPLTDDRSVEPEDRQRVESFLTRCLPGVSQQPTHHAVCYYTMSPDEHFIVDRHPQFPQVCFAAGLSGHGFKFTSVLGQVLADLALEGATTLPIEFLRHTRSGLM